MADAFAKKQVLLAIRAGGSTYGEVLEAYREWSGTEDLEGHAPIAARFVSDLLVDGYLDIDYVGSPETVATLRLTEKGRALVASDVLPRARETNRAKRAILDRLHAGRSTYAEALAADKRPIFPDGTPQGDPFDELLSVLIADGFVDATYAPDAGGDRAITHVWLTAKSRAAFGAGMLDDPAARQKRLASKKSPK